jgi:protein-S-isoprenylcysteine O-methyltransferase Ste14
MASENRENKKDHPGVYIPPPLVYALIFLAAMLIQKIIPFDNHFLDTGISMAIGFILILISMIFALPSLVKFMRTKNTLMTIKPAHSLQTRGIYSVSRNPMYVGLTLLYTGLSLVMGNWWNLILLPLLLVIVQEYIIKREEKYLTRRFGQEYLNYKLKVRRWL